MAAFPAFVRWSNDEHHGHPSSQYAASIGQVHFAQRKDGRHLAIKIQYPGVRQSIDSDVDNVASLLRVSGLLPKSLDIKPLLEEAKRQLHDEADYRLEGASMMRFAGLLADASEFQLPEMHADLTTDNILAMTRLDGVALEALTHLAQDLHRKVGGLYLLAAKLKAAVNMASIAEQFVLSS